MNYPSPASNFIQPLRRLTRGFTLIEILVVLGIIAALVTVVLTATGGTGARGKATADLQALATLQNNVDRFVQEYGSVPAIWNATNGLNKTLSAAELQNMMQTITGVLPAATDATVSAYCQNNPTMRINEDVANYSSRFTAVVTTSGTGSAPLGRVVILQYRKANAGLIVNGDNTVSTAFIAAATAIVPDFFNTTTNSGVWTGKAAWPFN